MEWRKGYIMKEEKGILGKLLLIVGAAVVAAGVFAFQGISSAEEDGNGTGGDVALSVTDPEEGEPESDPESDPEDLGEGEGTGDEGEGEEECVPVVCEEDDEECVPVECLPEEPEDPEEPGDEPEEPEPPVLKTYTLRYNANGGAGAPSPQTCETYDKSCGFVVADPVPSREGYEFRGWAKDGDTNNLFLAKSTVVNDDAEEPLTLYAVWAEIKTYTLMYDTNGGSGAPEVQACKSASGKCGFIVSGVTPSRVGFEFLGWIRGEESYNAGNEIIVTETNTILIANWNPIYNFTLNYVSEDGTENLPEAQKCETTMGTCTFIISTKEPTRKGYDFLGWRWDDKPDMRAKSGDELIVGIDGPLDLKIHAVWSKIYTVLNSGEVFGAGERVVLRSSASYDKLEMMTIDFVEVPMEYYVVSEGETTSIVLSNAFSQSLSIGEHAFEISWKDGKAGGVISVSQNEDGTKRFVVVDANGNPDSVNLMYRPKAGAVSKESTGVTADAATDNKESNFDAVRTLVIVAVAAFIVVYIVNRFYVRKKMDFIDEF